MEHAWHAVGSPAERDRLGRAGFGMRIGIGSRPAVLVIDVQNYMIGPPDGTSESDYPSACGPAADAALPVIAALLDASRRRRIPVFYTRFELKHDGSDAGVYSLKRKLLDIDGWCLEGTVGAEISPVVAPQAGDIVLVKKKPSAFHGTPLLGMLTYRNIDSLIITGGSTSNCVRATAVDAASYDYRTAIVSDCVFDRVEESHRVALFDLDRQYADVVTAAELIATLEKG